jgi:hypothetical protein
MDVYDAWNREIDHIPEKLQYIRLYQHRTENGQIAKGTFRPKYRKGQKRYNYSSLEAEGVQVLVDAYASFAKEYRHDLEARVAKDQRSLFFRILKQWVDGKSLRNGPAVKSLKKDVLSYLLHKYPTLSKDHIFSIEDVEGYPSAGISVETIKSIVALNEEYLDRYLDLIVEREGDDHFISNDALMLHRGINIPRNNEIASARYSENAFLTSYSLSISVAEKFAGINFGKKVIISGELKYFKNRVLATSLLHRDLLKSQLEFLVIPHWYTLELKRHDRFDGIEEYLLESPANYRGL